MSTACHAKVSVRHSAWESPNAGRTAGPHSGRVHTRSLTRPGPHEHEPPAKRRSGREWAQGVQLCQQITRPKPKRVPGWPCSNLQARTLGVLAPAQVSVFPKQTGFSAPVPQRLLGNVCIPPHLCARTASASCSAQGSRPEGRPRGSEALGALLPLTFPKLSPVLTDSLGSLQTPSC